MRYWYPGARNRPSGRRLPAGPGHPAAAVSPVLDHHDGLIPKGVGEGGKGGRPRGADPRRLLLSRGGRLHRGGGRGAARRTEAGRSRSEEHTSELQSLMRISYAVFCLKKKKITKEQSRKSK